VIAPNVGIGAVLLMKFAQEAARSGLQPHRG
jgi:dihydrodipicolinate reductase